MRLRARERGALLLKQRLQTSLAMPLPLLYQRVRHRLHNDWVRWKEKSDHNRPTYSSTNVRLRAVLAPGSIRLTPEQIERYRSLCVPIFEHKFDVLGSGLRSVKYGEGCEGFMGHRYESKTIPHDAEGKWLATIVNAANLDYARSVWREVGENYEPIDWQRDIRSGYRWSASEHHSAIRYGEAPGADVKVPWELARMQHLPVLALAAAGDSDRNRYSREFHDQVLDFIATNPPRYGVNWTLAMDVAIRAVNWLLTFDLFRSFGVEFSGAFEKTFAHSLYDHALYVSDHLEWNAVLRGNHYLANLAGLLWIGTYLEGDSSIERSRRFAATELVREIESQFYEEGSNFEGSIPYHRLSGEIAAYSIALAMADEKFQAGKALERLERAAEFSEFVSHASGEAAQFGDNDSGRFVKLEDDVTSDLDHHPFMKAVQGFCGAGMSVGAQVIRALSRGNKELPPRSEADAYPQFGVYRLQSTRILTLIRYGPVGQHGYGGHAHNDQGSFEMSVDGKLFIVDPGTFIYSADVEERNRFRSTKMQNTLAVEGREQNDWLPGRAGLFALRGDRANGKVIERSETSLIGEHRGFSEPHRREFVLRSSGLDVMEKCAAPGLKSIYLHLHPKVAAESRGETVILTRGAVRLRVSSSILWTVSDSQYSPGYGQLFPNKRLALTMQADTVSWSIEVLG